MQDQPRQDQVSHVTVACLYKGGQSLCGNLVTIDPSQQAQVLKVV